MRKLEKSQPAPAVLIERGSEATAELCSQVDNGATDLTFKPAIYNGDGVKSQLLSDQHDKCAFCESKRGRDFGAVEHYRPKGGWNLPGESPRDLHKPGYYWLAYAWENMLYSCSVCNTCYKKNLFPLQEENTRDIEHRDISHEEPLIINPYEEDPTQYLVFHENFILARQTDDTIAQKGQMTIDCLGLDSDELNELRFETWQEYKNACLALKIAENQADEESVEHFKRVIDKMMLPEGQYSGMLCNQE